LPLADGYAVDVRPPALAQPELPRHAREDALVPERSRYSGWYFRWCIIGACNSVAHGNQCWYQDWLMSRGKLKKVSDAIWALEVRALRQAMGLNQEEFAVRVGVAKSTIGYWERGEFKPHRKTKDRIRAACGIERATEGTRGSGKRIARRYSDEAIAAFHQALDMILDNAPNSGGERGRECLVQHAAKSGGPPQQ